MPYLNLPTFDGSPSEWLQFKDLFDSMVLSNVNLTPVWKLHYLKQCLKGTAAHLLKNTTLTNDNFQKAWDPLVSFYENKRLLVNYALHSLLTLKRMSKESSAEMEVLYTSVTQTHRSLETLGRPVNRQDDFFVFLTVQKLDSESVKAWELHLGSSQDPPTWKQLLEFLLTRLLTLKAVEKSRRPGTHTPQQGAKVNLASADQLTNNQCSICSADHYITKCSEYTGKSVKDRAELVKQKRLCFNCLGPHRVADCRSTRRCMKCGKKHHTTIHRTDSSESSKKSSTRQNNENSISEANATVNCASVNHASSPLQTLLATIQVNIISEKGERIQARALVDPGSQLSFISKRLVNPLHLSRKHSSIALLGIGAVKAGRTRGIVSLKLTPYFESTTEYMILAYILPKLTSRISSVKIDDSSLAHVKELQLADPQFQSPGIIDIIFGADYYGQILQEGLRQGSARSPTTQSTIFGWILFGPSNQSPPSDIQCFHTSVDDELL